MHYIGTKNINAFLQNEPAHTPEMAQLHHDAFTQFNAKQWPDFRLEEWKRTNITQYPLDEFTFLPRYTNSAVTKSAHTDENCAGLLEICDGQITTWSLSEEAAHAGAYFGPIAQAHESLQAQAHTLIKSGIQRADTKLLDWNYTLATYTLLLYVPQNVTIAKPFHIRHNAHIEDILISPQVCVVIETSASAHIVHEWNNENPIIVNEVHEVSIGENAYFNTIIMQNLSKDSLFLCNNNIDIAQNAHMNHFTSILGAGFCKTRIIANMNGENATIVLNGVYVLGSDQHTDIRSVQNHYAPHCMSNAIYKGILGGDAHSVYQGMIHVSPIANKTDAYLTNKNILLSDSSQSDSIPCLNILTDDVKCSHGSTTASLNEGELFYLESRGLTRGNAKQLLLSGFCEALLDTVPHYYARVIAQQIEASIAEIANID